jgi:alpha-tubulin suppressor-like RCC1 family protein
VLEKFTQITVPRVVQIASGGASSVVLTEIQQVYQWNDQLKPWLINDLKDIVKISCGQWYFFSQVEIFFL